MGRPAVALGVGGILAMTVPPLVGAWSDRLNTRFGRRRPIMVAGTLLTFPGLVVLTVANNYLEVIAGCAANVGFDAGDRLFREGDPANVFFLVRHGVVTLETHVPNHGTFDRAVTTSGMNAAVWRGGSLATLLSRAPGAQSVWVFQDGRPYGYVIGAPDFVNARFNGIFPDGIVSTGTIVFVVQP